MSTAIQLPFRCSRRVEFADTDAAGIVHFSSYFRYMEFAEAAFFRRLGWPLLEQRDDGAYGFPRIHTEARYKAPLFFEDEVHIELNIQTLEHSRIHYEFSFEKAVAGSHLTVATGTMRVVYVKRGTDLAKLVPVDIPPSWRNQLQALITQ
ncbi:MAG: acyl-CoA thioesterase [Opitutales bacterium]|nr:acyl-CoA thioesterase [Opitutales bacterium]